MSSREVMDESAEYRARLIGDALRRQAWIIVAAAALGALLGYGASLARPGSYVATAQVTINPLAGNPYDPSVSGQDAATAVQTEAKVASSDSVSELVARQMHEDPGKLEKGVSVSVLPNSQIIEFAFASGNASFAHEAAQAFADTYLDYRADQTTRVNADQVASLTDQQNTVRGELSDANTKKAHGVPGQDPLIKSYQSQIASLGAQINALKAQKPGPGRVISQASTPSARSGFGRMIYVAGGMILGLVGGVALALARQRRDERILHADEIEAADIPVIATWGATPERAAEATRLIRARALAVSKRPAVIVVGASHSLPGQSGVGAQLAESIANVGRSVVFADLAGEPDTSTGKPVPFGLTDLLTGRRSALRDLLVERDANLTLLPRGRAHLVDAIEFLDAARMRKVIDELPQRADYIVLHVPSLTDSVGETMMEIANLSVVTVTFARSTRSELAVVKGRGGDRVGACVTPRPKRRSRRTNRKSRREGSTRVSRSGDGLTLIDDGEEEIPA
jgi:capsular polysaccharide biosynthesis protein